MSRHTAHKGASLLHVFSGRSRRWRGAALTIIGALLAATLVPILPGTAAAAEGDAQATVGIQKTLEPGQTATPAPGSNVVYNLQYNCSALEGSCGAMTITDVLPPGLEYVTNDFQTPVSPSGVPMAPIQVNVGPATAGNNGTITITSANLPDGVTGNIKLTLRVTPATTAPRSRTWPRSPARWPPTRTSRRR